MPHRILKPNSRLKNPICLIQSIHDHCSKEQIKQAIESIGVLARKGLRLDSNTINLLLQKCAQLRLLREGKWVHTHLKFTGLKQPNLLVLNNLINMYAKCGDHVEARKVFDKMPIKNLYSWNNLLSGYAGLGMVKPARRVFDKMPEKDVVSWNTMVIAYARKGCCNEALRVYKDLRGLSISLNEFSFAGVLTVCVKMRDVWLIRQVHCQVFIMGYSSNVVISSSIVDSYWKSGALIEGRRVFDEMSTKDILAWTTMVSGYAKSGDMKSAAELFNLMPEKNPISWTALISGYVRNNMGVSALELFTNMMLFHIKPDQYTFSSCLCACASIASLKHGKQIHAYMMRTGFKPNTIVVSSLIDMYSKSGNLNFARWVFAVMGNKQHPMLWNTMISALAHHGHCDETLKFYNDMVSFGVKPDRVTFVIIIGACSHSGYVEDGLKYFNSMSSDCGIVPDQEHYACLVDLLGQAGCFEEMLNQIGKMPFRPDTFVCNALLDACKIHENLDLAIQAAEKLIEMEPQSSNAYLVLATIYESLGRWEAVEKVRRLMNERHVKKE